MSDNEPPRVPGPTDPVPAPSGLDEMGQTIPDVGRPTGPDAVSPEARPSSDPGAVPEEPSDHDLLGRVRHGDDAAAAALWARHAEAATRAAQRITGRFDPDDLREAAFGRIAADVRAGAGPQDAFRRYLYAVLYRIAQDWALHDGIGDHGRRTDASGDHRDDHRDDHPRDDLGHVDDVIDDPLADAGSAKGGEGLGDVEERVTREAYTSLEPVWREVLWYTEVEKLSSREVAPLLGVSAARTSALAYRAREGLSIAWLGRHARATGAPPECQWVMDHLGDVERAALTRRERRRLEEHLRSCRRCAERRAKVGSVAAALLACLPMAAVVRPGATRPADGPARRRRAGPRTVAAAAAATGVVLASAVGVRALVGEWQLPAVDGETSAGAVSAGIAPDPSTGMMTASRSESRDPTGAISPTTASGATSVSADPSTTDPAGTTIPSGVTTAPPSSTPPGSTPPGSTPPGSTPSGSAPPGSTSAAGSPTVTSTAPSSGSTGPSSSSSGSTPSSSSVTLPAPTVAWVVDSGPSRVIAISGGPGLRVEVWLDGVRVDAFTMGDGGRTARSLTGLAPGRHTVAVRFLDPGTGTPGPWTTWSFTV